MAEVPSLTGKESEVPIVSMKAGQHKPAGEKGHCFINVCMEGGLLIASANTGI